MPVAAMWTGPASSLPGPASLSLELIWIRQDTRRLKPTPRFELGTPSLRGVRGWGT